MDYWQKLQIDLYGSFTDAALLQQAMKENWERCAKEGKIIFNHSEDNLPRLNPYLCLTLALEGSKYHVEYYVSSLYLDCGGGNSQLSTNVKANLRRRTSLYFRLSENKKCFWYLPF